MDIYTLLDVNHTESSSTIQHHINTLYKQTSMDNVRSFLKTRPQDARRVLDGCLHALRMSSFLCRHADIRMAYDAHVRHDPIQAQLWLRRMMRAKDPTWPKAPFDLTTRPPSTSPASQLQCHVCQRPIARDPMLITCACVRHVVHAACVHTQTCEVCHTRTDAVPFQDVTQLYASPRGASHVNMLSRADVSSSLLM